MEYGTDSAAQAAYVSDLSSITATGGTITYSGGYKIHTFTSNGTFTINVSTNVEVLVVGGGGGGGGDQGGGGGGGGGFIYRASFSVVAQGYNVTVGAGGTGNGTRGGTASAGSVSVFDTITAAGGAGGPSMITEGLQYVVGFDGGSGSGASNWISGTTASGGSGNTPSVSPPQGNNGGTATGNSSGHVGGGGGGAGGAGGAGINNNGGNGGVGLSCSISGTAVLYAGGGGGGCYYAQAGNGGNGGGGKGLSNTGTHGSPGSGATDHHGGVNLGGGGGGAGGTGGNGGSGIVIIRYSTATVLQSYSESSLKTQGSYSLKGNAGLTTSLNKTLTRTVSPTIDLTDREKIKFDIRSTRTGSNIKIGIRDSGGTTTYITPNITAANEYQTVEWDISSVANSDKDAIDRIIIQIVNADAANTFYIDNLFAPNIPPNAPTINRAKSLSETSLEWGWQDNSSGGSQEDGFKVYSSTGGLLTNRTADTTFWIETGLKRNKEYSRYVRVYNDAGEADSSTATWRTKPGAFQSRTSQGNPTRTGTNAFGFIGDAAWEWDVPVKAGATLTITAYIRYNSDYGAASKPKLTLSGRGITPTSISATVAAEDAWELLTLNPGTPTENAILTLKAEGFSNTPAAKFYIDDVNISQ